MNGALEPTREGGELNSSPPLKLYFNRGVARILHWGGTEVERQRRENRGAEERWGFGKGCSPPQPTKKNVVNSPAGGSRALAASAFLAHLSPTEHFW